MSDRGKTYPVEYETLADEIERVAGMGTYVYEFEDDLRGFAARVRSLTDENKRLREAVKHGSMMADWIERVSRNSFGSDFDRAWHDLDENPECGYAADFRDALTRKEGGE